MSYDEAKLGKGFDTSFTIPKVKGNKNDLNNTELHPSSAVLANAYGNIPNSYQAYVLQNYNNEIATEWATFLNTPSINPSSATETTNNLQENPNTLKRTWLNANSTPSNSRYKDTFGDLHDSTLPKELLSLFQPLFCKLCMIQLSSNIMAKMHYKAKNHDRAVRTWLFEYSKNTGEPLHKRATLPRLKKDEEYNPKYYHCDVCDLALTGQTHAESHYMGRNHQRALYGKKTPTGTGYYNDEGKWIRTGNAKKDEQETDDFGRDFDKTSSKSARVTPGGFRCDICNISVTSMPQLDVHFHGQKHKKKLKLIENLSTSPYNDNEETEIIDISKTNPDILSSYRTPSGQFYCKTCNLSVNSETQFMQHLKSKKHGKKSVQPAPATVDDIFMHL